MHYQVVLFPDNNGVPEGIRTPDLLVRSQTLYPAELRAHVCNLANTYQCTIIDYVYDYIHYILKKSIVDFFNSLHGGSSWNRTSDTRIFSPLLYRLSYETINGGPDENRTRDLLRDRQT